MNFVCLLLSILCFVGYIYLELSRDGKQAHDFIKLVEEKTNGTNDVYSAKALKKFENTVKKSRDSKEHLYGALLYDHNISDTEKALDNYLLAVQYSNDRDSTFMALNKLRDFVTRQQQDLDEEVLKRVKDYEFKAITKYREEAANGYDFAEEDNQPAVQGDPQNVHDFAVYKNLNKKLDHLRKLYPNCMSEQEINDTILEYVAQHTNSDNNRKMRRVKKLLRQFSYANEIDGFGSDLFCLQMVWTRAMRTNNDNLKDSIIEMLSESMNDRGEVTCLMGRCTRLLDALTMIDEDEKLKYAVQSTTMLRQEIFSKAADILKEQLEYYKTEVPVESEHHESYMSFAERYERGDVFADDDIVGKTIERKFKSQLKIKLNFLLEKYKDQLSQPTIDLIKKEIEIGYDIDTLYGESDNFIQGEVVGVEDEEYALFTKSRELSPIGNMEDATD